MRARRVIKGQEHLLRAVHLASTTDDCWQKPLGVEKGACFEHSAREDSFSLKFAKNCEMRVTLFLRISVVLNVQMHALVQSGVVDR